MRAIKFTKEYFDFRAKSPTGVELELCPEELYKVVRLPTSCETIYVVPLKNATPDTVKIEDCVTEDRFYLLVDGEKTEFVYATANFIRKTFLANSINYFRIEY